MRTRIYITAAVLVCAGLFQSANAQKDAAGKITTGSLLHEMTDLERLAGLDLHPYKTLQFSSYDRHSTRPDAPGWFANNDGFGGEEIPAFEKVLRAPDADGTGEYLICDVRGPGAISRLWTAGISGQITMMLDGKTVYSGPAEPFFWNFPNLFPDAEIELEGTFRQFDALYFPIPFARSCRIEWKGSIRDTHFYHVGMKLYGDKTPVRTFTAADPVLYRDDISATAEALKITSAPGGDAATGVMSAVSLPVGGRERLCRLEGEKAIREFSMKVQANSTELRKLVLRIYFDGATVPQVESPVGDFFGAAPGNNPYTSLPMSVGLDSVMTCRFVMPFRSEAIVEVENLNDRDVAAGFSVEAADYAWDAANSMYFRARWRADHGLNTSKYCDIPYLLAQGEGRVVGAACYLMNPSNVPSSYGNWWGEGDEKIYVDDMSKPAFFGTGSEDYFNYSWSIDDIFYYPYCGQPRNDGPANRGFVSNYRWHIADDIPFDRSLAFFMELYTHGKVEGFSYARMVYLYARESLIDDHVPVTADDTRELKLPPWQPVPYLGSAGYCFIQAEYALKRQENSRTGFIYGPLWAEGRALLWKPEEKGEKLDFAVRNHARKGVVKITMAQMPGGGKVGVLVNGKAVKLKAERFKGDSFGEVKDMNERGRTVSRTYNTEEVEFVDGENIITFENHSETGSAIGIDMLWIKI